MEIVLSKRESFTAYILHYSASGIFDLFIVLARQLILHQNCSKFFLDGKIYNITGIVVMEYQR